MDPTLSQDDQWELSLDIDDSDLQLTQNPVRIIPGPAGLVQTTNLDNENDQWEHLFLRLTLVLRPSSKYFVQNPTNPQGQIQEGGVDSVLSTQEYMKKVVEDVGDDEDFKSGSWVSATDYVNANGGIVSGCLGDIKKFLNKGKLDQVVAIVCSLNALGDLTVTMKDLPGTIPRTIHHKVIGEGGCEKDITVEAALILANVFVFSPKPSMHYLNITKKNVVKVFRKDTVSESGSGSD
ncbi:GPCR kinase [Tanacetum coccineum]|uniref:GPCR kinase n=1 Tax=Tanacetum coccineum TaxID=301880 RepID=A0ABQ5CRS8_9ASTR